MRDRFPRHQERSVEIDGQDPSPEGEGHLVHPLVGDDARVVAEHVEAPKSLDAGRDARARLFFVADVHGAELHLCPELRRALGRVFEARGDNVRQEERCPLTCGAEGRGAADPRSGARQQQNLVVQSTYRRSLRRIQPTLE